MTFPTAWQQHILETFEEAGPREDRVARYNAYIELMKTMPMESLTKERIMRVLGDMARYSMESTSELDRLTVFGSGAALRAYVQYCVSGGRDPELWRQICSSASRFGTLAEFLEAVLVYLEAPEFSLDMQAATVERIIEHLINNLATSSHVLRSLSLRIIGRLYFIVHQQDAESISTALMIENSPLDLQSARNSSMLVRRLAGQYASASSDAWIQRAIPHFCFGLLTFKLSQLWDDAVTTLKEICQVKAGEEIVSTIAFRWLEMPSNIDEPGGSSKQSPKSQPLTEFHCSNLIKCETLADTCMDEGGDVDHQLTENFDSSHCLLTPNVHRAAAQALRVLGGIPHVAEKRSRFLVPLLLRWTRNEMKESSEAPMDDSETHVESTYTVLARKDRQAMLELFSLFNNPKVLYRSSDVFAALLSLLSNGNVDIQKAALKAVFTWKLPGLLPYQENLLNLLDDARFREEISVFVHVNDEGSVIEKNHRNELVPVLLKILYGKIIARTGTTSGRRGQAAKRRAVLEALARFDEADMEKFVMIALEPLHDVVPLNGSQLLKDSIAHDRLSVRKQFGMVNMMKDMLETLGSRLAPFTNVLANALIYCLIRATRELSDPADGVLREKSDAQQTSLLKNIRQVGLQCLALLFQKCSAEQLHDYAPVLFTELIEPRLEKLPIETAQSVSGILQLFSVWAQSKDTVLFLAQFNPKVLRSIIDCLDVPSAKDEVKLFVLEEILKKIISLAALSDNEESGGNMMHVDIVEQMLRPNIDMIFYQVGGLLRKSPSKELLGSAIHLISLLAPIVASSSQIGSFLDISVFLLDQPSQRVSPRSKGDLLRTMKHFIPSYDLAEATDLQDRIFRTVSSLFGYFKDRENRLVLSEVLKVLALKNESLHEVAALSASLNSFSTKRLDEPDFDERLKAFNLINESRYKEFTAEQWRPLLFNMLYYIKDSEELAIRSNASLSLRRFIETVKVGLGTTKTQASALVEQVLLPALRNGILEQSELVRTEYLTVMAHLIRHNPEWTDIGDMRVLLVEEDEEASFFENVLHIQQHRRLRALRRLATEASRGRLGSSNVAHFFLPLIEHFIFDKADDEGAHNLAAETVLTIGALAESLEWPQFRAVFRRYNSYIQSKPDIEKTMIKLLGTIIDALARAASKKEQMGQTSPLDVAAADAHSESDSNIDRVPPTLTITMPRQEKLTEALTNNLLPSLLKYLHNKDESTVSLRVPIAVSVVKLLKLLPSDRMTELLPPVLTDVCHILRSRAQESRDLTRKTLVDISTLIGPSCFGFVLKELRSALARGYQLHVLSFTVHSILVATASIFKPGDLDYCLPQVVSVIMDDIFGVTGQEKDAEEYISKMREVKSSKSYDSMELVAKTVTVGHLINLIRPLQVLLGEKLDLKMVKKIDELLRRIGVGLLRNNIAQSHGMLVFCYEVIHDVQIQDKAREKTTKEDYRTKRYLVQLRAGSKYGSRGSTSSYTYKLIRFSLDVLRSVLHKYDTLPTPANLAGFMPVIGDALLQSQEEVQTSVLRLLTTIVKVPLKEIDDNAGVYVAEAVKMIKASTSTNTELSQAALKLISAILRERKNFDFKETDLAYLLKRLKPDLEEPDRQGVTFNFLKAVLVRKVIITEVYEVLDSVAAIMITNQTRGARDLARGVYFQFLMEYPQGKDRLAKQLGFLVKNLEYKHLEGRQSVMEAIHLLLSKTGENLIQEVVGTFFVPLIMVITNDESAECREMAGALVKEVFERADAERSQTFLNLLRTWIDQNEQPLLVRIALLVYGIYFDVKGAKADKDVQYVRDRLDHIFASNVSEKRSGDWELLYFALQSLAKICQVSPVSAFAASCAPLWASVRDCLFFPHAWVKFAAAKLLGLYFADFAKTNAEKGYSELPLGGSGGLWLGEEDILQIIRASLGLLRVPGISEELAAQSVRNSVFLGRVAGSASMLWKPTKQGMDEENPEDDIGDDAEDGPGELTLGPETKSVLQYIFERCSAIIRRETLTTRAPSLIPKTAALQLIAALCSHVPVEHLIPCTGIVLLPLHNLMDPAIPAPYSSDPAFTSAYKSLVTTSQEVMALLQKKLGTTEYVRQLTRVREGVKKRREGRKVKRRIEAVAAPEKFGREKKRKGEKKREKRKEKSADQRAGRRGW